MCGIVLEYFKDGTVPRICNMPAMLDAIKHRGMDSVAIDRHENCTVGYRRLAITNINEAGNTAAGWSVYINGEIYNYKELGFFGTETEVLCQGFEKYGLKFAKKLNGMFFIVAVNGKDVYIVRDRYGIKPAYIYECLNKIIVASEIKSILTHPEYKKMPCMSAKYQWCVFNNVLTDETLFYGIKKVEKGTVLHINSGVKTKFWKWEFTPTEMDYDTAKKTIKALVTQAIYRQVPKEVPYCSCLSGGVDSNIIACTLGCKTYTAAFEGVQDERYLAKITGTINQTVMFDRVSNLQETVYHLEDLRAGASWSNYGLYKCIAIDGFKVCFDGAGADELFGGYPWRYKAEDYYTIVNRTGLTNDWTEFIFKKKFPSDTLENRFLFDADYFLEGVLLAVDKLSMAHTIEMRVPFLDNDLVDFCLTLPNEFKENKKILKDAFRGFLPEAILNGPKRGFSSPDWFEGDGNQALKWANAAYKQWSETFNL